MAETWLRVVIYRMSDRDDQQAAEYVKSSTQNAVRVMEKQPGYQLGYWGHNPADGTMGAITYWDSLEAIEAAEPVLSALQDERKQQGLELVSVRNIHLFALSAARAWEQPAQGAADAS
jgi:hypothetical protein